MSEKVTGRFEVSTAGSNIYSIKSYEFLKGDTFIEVITSDDRKIIIGSGRLEFIREK